MRIVSEYQKGGDFIEMYEEASSYQVWFEYPCSRPGVESLREIMGDLPQYEEWMNTLK